MWSTLIAVTGTLLAGVLAHILQQRATDRRDRVTRDDQATRDRAEALVDLAVALADHRRAMWMVGEARLTGCGEARVTELRDAAHATRSAVTAPAVRARLLIRDTRLRALADAAVQAVYRMRDADTLDALAAARTAALAAHDALIDAAARQRED